ncbi:hypothetical protein [Paenibacillus caseinilyticus]|uniref:hypothetical protein n=1 Tax=Paenibacillus caseinilyticus TaxID=3098138 RepID=UPI0022B8805E|nr:hypothetical protein [Paenibacillus caseinilyticus]MCZ8518900.1 hypothetical protein [Paenibacillus caseinilyticus]
MPETILSAEALARLERLEAKHLEVVEQLKGMSGELLRLNTEGLKSQQQIRVLEETDKRHQEDLRVLQSTQEGIKTSINMLVTEFASFKSEVFALLRQNMASGSAESSSLRKDLMALLRWVLAGTIIYLVMRGEVPVP